MSAFKKYERQLIRNVKDDIEHLHDKFKVSQSFFQHNGFPVCFSLSYCSCFMQMGYQNGGAAIADEQKGIPPVAGCVM